MAPSAALEALMAVEEEPAAAPVEPCVGVDDVNSVVGISLEAVADSEAEVADALFGLVDCEVAAAGSRKELASSVKDSKLLGSTVLVVVRPSGKVMVTTFVGAAAILGGPLMLNEMVTVRRRMSGR